MYYFRAAQPIVNKVAATRLPRSNMPRCKRHKLPNLPANTVPRKPVTKPNEPRRADCFSRPLRPKWSPIRPEAFRTLLTAHKPARKFQSKTSSIVSSQPIPRAPLRPTITPESAITAFFFSFVFILLILAARNESRA